MSYLDMKHSCNEISKDKILRQSPFDACLSILGGNRPEHSLDDRYNGFFIDYSLLPLLVQQNYVDAAKNGIFKNPQLSEDQKLDLLADASDAVSDMDLIGELYYYIYIYMSYIIYLHISSYIFKYRSHYYRHRLPLGAAPRTSHVYRLRWQQNTRIYAISCLSSVVRQVFYYQ